MAVRVVCLLLSAWILLSAFALPRPEIETLAYASMGIFCLVAELVTFALPSFRYANGVNAALLLVWALYFPATSAITSQNDIISSGLLLVFSCGFPGSSDSSGSSDSTARPVCACRKGGPIAADDDRRSGVAAVGVELPRSLAEPAPRFRS